MKEKTQDKLQLRFAGVADTPAILEFIRELAEYEKMSDQVTATEEGLRETLFEKKQAEVIIAEWEDVPVGFALFFSNYSTFLGKAGIYLEDLYVRPSMRGKGIGKKLLSRLAKTAVERGCGRLEWSCLDWNTPSIEFYKGLGAEPQEEWTGYRVTGTVLKGLAEETYILG